MVYPALLPLMRTPRLPIVDWTEAPADLNGLVRFAERRNLVSARVQDQDVPSWSCSKAVYKPAWHTPLLYVQWKTPDDGYRNCPKHVEFHSKNKFEKLLLLVRFIIRITIIIRQLKYCKLQRARFIKNLIQQSSHSPIFFYRKRIVMFTVTNL